MKAEGRGKKEEGRRRRKQKGPILTDVPLLHQFKWLVVFSFYFFSDSSIFWKFCMKNWAAVILTPLTVT